MNVYELNVKIYLKDNLKYKYANSELCSLIDKTLARDKEFLKLHNENKFKFYTFNNLYPLAQKGVYAAGNIYTFLIRTINKDLVNYLKKYLENEYTNIIKVLAIEVKIIPKKDIEKIYSITPAICKFSDGYWKNNHTVDEFEVRLKENIIKKYNDYFNKKIDEDFQLFNFIKFDNKKPVSVKYKNIKLLGDKITLNMASNEIAQKLAYFALGTGILEMNSRGMGFINFKSA